MNIFVRASVLVLKKDNKNRARLRFPGILTPDFDTITENSSGFHVLHSKNPHLSATSK